MSISKKITFAIAGIIIILGVFDITLGKGLLRNSFEKIEEQLAVKDILRCTGSIEREIRHLELLTTDWSAWDETYNFIMNPGEEYIDANLPDSSFSSNELNLIAFYNSNGEQVWARDFNLETEEPLGLELLRKNPQDTILGKLLHHKSLKDNHSGIILTETGPMLISATPILTSEDEGPIRGTMLMGRLLTQDYVNRLAKLTRVDLQIQPIESGKVEKPPGILESIGKDSAYHISVVDEQTLKIYSLLNNLEGKPALLVSATINRDFMKAADKALTTSIIISLLGLLIFFLVVYGFLQVTISKPLISLSRMAVELGDVSKKKRSPLPLDRNDEIGVLASEFDKMRSKLFDFYTTLERQVKHRTLQLESANDLLQMEIEEKEDARREVTASRENLRNIIESMHDMLFVLNENMEIKTINNAGLNALGYEKNEIIGRDIRTILQNDCQGLKNFPSDLDRDNVPKKSQEADFLRKNGRTVHTICSISPLVASDGKTRELLCVAKDLTDIEEIELRFDKQSRFAQTSRLASLGEMATGIAHEINQPLAIIRLAIQFLENQAENNLPISQEKSVLEKINNQVDRASVIINNMLTFARSSVAPHTIVDLKDPINIALSFFNEQFRLHQIALHKYFADDLPGASLNTQKFEQVMVNLLSNARLAVEEKKLKEGEEYAMEIDVRLDRGEDGKTLIVEVEDNGIGMSDITRQRCLEPFYSTREHQKGTGLGLSISYSIITEFGGLIEVESKEGKGSTFRIILPAAEHPENRDVEEQETAGNEEMK